MAIEDVDPLLQNLADDPGDYDRQGGTALLMRQGHEHMLQLRETPGAGVSVLIETQSNQPELVPLGTYVQRDILGLPRLAKQILRTFDRIWGNRPVAFVEGPAEFESGSRVTAASQASLALSQHLLNTEMGTTTLIQLMAPAGQGKTALLEHLSSQHALKYQPEPYPSPLLLPVDLLGRFVGTIDDAIAGTLNNTFVFPALSQRDVVLCLKRRWLLLALDGFDELVARVGVRDAFGRVTELLDQLRGEGTVVLSARESFFELYQITSAIRTYLQPKSGSYASTVMRLMPWSEPQGYSVFRHLHSTAPQQDLEQLLQAFDSDRSIVFHPFFLTRLANLWMKGERFAGAASQPGRLTRTKYVIETFIHRESAEKWVDRDGQMLLTVEGHAVMLSAIAEEMWRSGAFRLTADELRLASEIGLAEMDISRHQVDEALERIPTHAALVSRDRTFSFIHDQFLHFYLGFRLARLLATRDHASVMTILSARELGPSIVQWVVWHLSRGHLEIPSILRWLNDMRSSLADSLVASNIGHLVSHLVADRDLTSPVHLERQVISGDMLRGSNVKLVHFIDCEFWNLDLSSTVLHDCEFRNCTFGDVRFSSDTSFLHSVFLDCRWNCIMKDDDHALFSPSDIDALLISRGADVHRDIPEADSLPLAVRWDIGRCVRRYVRQSEKTCDVAIGEMEEYCGRIADEVARLGIKHQVLREIRRDASGPKKEFVRFQVDRDRLLRGQAERTGDVTIDSFWDALRRKYPGR